MDVLDRQQIFFTKKKRLNIWKESIYHIKEEKLKFNEIGRVWVPVQTLDSKNMFLRLVLIHVT